MTIDNSKDAQASLTLAGLQSLIATMYSSKDEARGIDGTFMWLTDPKNFIWVVHAGTRTASEYEKDNDRWEFVIYNKVDALVEELDAVVKAVDLRIRDI